jgi:hypothetical protein
MTLDETEIYFGTLYRACKMLDITVQNITKWKKQGYIPLLQQYRIAEMTNGYLLPDELDPSPKFKHRKGITSIPHI